MIVPDKLIFRSSHTLVAAMTYDVFEVYIIIEAKTVILLKSTLEKLRSKVDSASFTDY